MESQNPLKLSFTNIGLSSNLNRCDSFLESKSPHIFSLCETNFNDSFDSSNFSLRSYLPLIPGDYVTHMHGLALYMKEGLPFAQDFFLKNSQDSYLFPTGFTSLSVLLFFLFWSPSSYLCTIFDAISSKIDQVLLIKPSVNVFLFHDFNVYHKDGLTYSARTDRPG